MGPARRIRSETGVDGEATDFGPGAHSGINHRGLSAAVLRVEGPGFPLDDAWIHQTYARNLALRGEWAFIPGKLSAGSTAPLWTVLLGVGQWLRQPVGWAYALGGVCLLGLAWIGERLFRRLAVRPAGSFPWMGVFLLTEWHLVWAAVSGMEILLYAVGHCEYLLPAYSNPAALVGYWGLDRTDGVDPPGRF
jgi:hypothetical protein